jgi:hypothetical protein
MLIWLTVQEKLSENSLCFSFVLSQQSAKKNDWSIYCCGDMSCVTVYLQNLILHGVVMLLATRNKLYMGENNRELY